MKKMAYVFVRIPVPLRLKRETPNSAAKHIIERLKDVGYVGEIIYASYEPSIKNGGTEPHSQVSS